MAKTVISGGLLLAAVVATGCSGSYAGEEGAGEVAIDGAPVYFLDYQTTAPGTWEAREPASSMRLAEFGTPGVEDAEGAEVVVFFFGPGQGGSVEANITRWQAQFTSPDGHVIPEVTALEDVAFPITVAEFTGTYARTVGMSVNPADGKPDQSLVAAVVETPSGNLFLQLWGPSASVASARDGFLAFVRGIAPSPHRS